ncbi:winged helix-turn-helix DNA-binding family protein [Burkholderia sp. MSHR3999]|uniref:helix-turn-helix domain-containing protein n=1 Tax=Burkholderia sp. MSHR3999 TaxID=1542965 RepID=UPI0005ACB04B|nr:helix-turn-helix domain-containing protein [Burkholderia sp. MSHR3999]KIP18761.1 winged helix-turn-helix DNA-binding family protein [Burkholderia sp. MSHR3999]
MQTVHAEGMHRADIKALIYKKGQTMSGIARTFGISESSVRNALIRPVLSGELAISEFVEVPPHKLWPERWTVDGRRIRPRYRHKYIGAETGPVR